VCSSNRNVSSTIFTSSSSFRIFRRSVVRVLFCRCSLVRLVPSGEAVSATEPNESSNGSSNGLSTGVETGGEGIEGVNVSELCEDMVSNMKIF